MFLLQLQVNNNCYDANLDHHHNEGKVMLDLCWPYVALINCLNSLSFEFCWWFFDGRVYHELAESITSNQNPVAGFWKRFGNHGRPTFRPFIFLLYFWL